MDKQDILDFENVDDYGSGDFNITMLLNSTILYQFPDSDMVSGEKIYYHGNFYTEIENVIDDIHFFEYGKVIFGEQVNDILNHGILVTMLLYDFSRYSYYCYIIWNTF